MFLLAGGAPSAWQDAHKNQLCFDHVTRMMMGNHRLTMISIFILSLLICGVTCSSPSSPLESVESISSTSSLEVNKEKRKFFDKISFVSSALLRSEKDAVIDDRTDPISHPFEQGWEELEDEDEVTYQSDLTRPGRHIFVVTTATIPWFTGTSVNPLLRAAYLCRRVQKIHLPHNTTTTIWDDSCSNSTTTDTTTTQQPKVTLVIPWLELEEDRQELYGSKFNFTTPQDQELYIRNWLRQEAGMPEESDPIQGLQILFYSARYHSGLKSIFAMGDICSLIPDDMADVCILEEPEHLNWYRSPGTGWTKKFHFVIGVIHTNYVEYASSHYSGLWTAPAIAVMSSAMVRAYCHVVIKLSDTLQTFAPEKERTSNVHGVRWEFIQEGIRRSKEYDDAHNNLHSFSSREAHHGRHHHNNTTVYFIGKILWTKGFDKMLEMENYYKQCTGHYFAMDIYGNGPEEKEIQRAFLGRKPLTEAVLDFDLPKSRYEWRKIPIPATFPGRIDHALLKEQYKVFVNPSLSEVLCTTTAEALAMGKFVIIPVHPSNYFFLQFPNCLAYRNKMEFVANLHWALSHEPEPLSLEHQAIFSWESATERLIKAARVTRREAKERHRLGTAKLDERIAWFHNELGKGSMGDTLRKVLGGGPIADQVKYETLKKQAEAISNGSFNQEENDDEGLSIKFLRSSLAEAIRNTFVNGISFS